MQCYMYKYVYDNNNLETFFGGNIYMYMYMFTTDIGVNASLCPSPHETLIVILVTCDCPSLHPTNSWRSGSRCGKA